VKAKKPFVVSMGDVAGSGGYYVACAADTIFADENTITASIGVVAGKFITTPMWDKVGVSFKGYARGKNAGMLSSSAPFSDAERKRMQDWMDGVYKTFRGHVTAARGDRLKKPLDEIAGGRVYTGRQALELGLVDKIGTMSDAVAFVAEKAKLEKDYDVRVVPKPKNFIEQMMASAGGEDESSRGIQLRSGPASLVDLAMPHLQHLDPVRVRAVRSALGRLQLLQEEGVLLTMPEIILQDSGR
jgi:protease-4